MGYGPRSGIRRSRLNYDSSLAYRLKYDHDPEYQLDFDSEYGPDDGEVGPQASRPLQSRYRRFTSLDETIALHETVPLLRDMCEKAAREDARMEWPAETSGETFVLPPLPPRVHAEEATVTATVSATLEANAAGITALRAHLAKIGYNLTPEEDKSLDLRDAHGRVDCTLVVNGFPVHPRNPWLGPAGGGIAASMMAHAMQLGSCGLLDRFCRIDIFPGARHYREGKNLDRETMAETAR